MEKVIMKNWIINSNNHENLVVIESIVKFIMNFFIEIFGESIMDNEPCKISNGFGE